MSKQSSMLLACAVGAALIGPFATAGIANAGDNPFGLAQLDGSYTRIAMEEGKCGDAKKAPEETGKCGAKKEAEEKGKDDAKATEHKTAKGGKCGSAKCGANKNKH